MHGHLFESNTMFHLWIYTFLNHLQKPKSYTKQMKFEIVKHIK